jgi:hypothetical protein
MYIIACPMWENFALSEDGDNRARNEMAIQTEMPAISSPTATG